MPGLALGEGMGGYTYRVLHKYHYDFLPNFGTIRRDFFSDKNKLHLNEHIHDILRLDNVEEIPSK